MMKKFILTLSVVLLSAFHAYSQDFAIKTNVLSDAFRNANLGIEFGLAPRWTVDVSGEYNAWPVEQNAPRWKHWSAQPEARYWFCDRFSGHFLGIHAHGGQYNIGGIKSICGLKTDFAMLGTDFSKLAETRFQGWFAGAGIAYGYAFLLGEHWNLEAELGVGYSYTEFDRYSCIGCGKKIETAQPHHYIGITKAAINLVYVF